MSSLTVIVVDDHAVVRRGLRDVLGRAPGIEVVAEAGDGDEGVRLACEHRPDVAVVDVAMPGTGGPEVTKLIRERCPEVAVLALSMHDDRVHLYRMLEVGAAGYVLKQSSPEELIRAIRIVASGQVYVDPTLGGSVLRREVRRKEAPASREALSAREEEVLRLVAWGHGNTEIGKRLDISPRTVETYRSRIGEKLGIQTRPEMVRYAVLKGWLDAD